MDEKAAMIRCSASWTHLDAETTEESGSEKVATRRVWPLLLYVIPEKAVDH